MRVWVMVRTVISAMTPPPPCPPAARIPPPSGTSAAAPARSVDINDLLEMQRLRSVLPSSAEQVAVWKALLPELTLDMVNQRIRCPFATARSPTVGTAPWHVRGVLKGLDRP